MATREKSRELTLAVMVSSTARDLREHRMRVKKACDALGIRTEMMEHMDASDAHAVDESLKLVNRADIYVGIVGSRYGDVPEGYRGKSFTELEYDRARRLGMPCLMFLTTGDHLVRDDDREPDAKHEKLREFRHRVERDRVVSFFSSPEEFENQALKAIVKLRDDLRKAERKCRRRAKLRARSEKTHVERQTRLAAKLLALCKDDEVAAAKRSVSPLGIHRDPVDVLGHLARRRLADQHPATIDELVEKTVELVEEEEASEGNWCACAALLGRVFRDLLKAGYPLPTSTALSVVRHNLPPYVEPSDHTETSLYGVVDATEFLGLIDDGPVPNPKTEVYWVRIPQGEYWAACEPRDSCVLGSYQIGRRPVTVAEFRRFVDEGGYRVQAHWQGGGFGKFRKPEAWTEQLLYPNRPVVRVNWYEASAYASWANARLPTEVEWERAAVGVNGRRYAWGDDPPTPSRLNFVETKIGGPTPVGIFRFGATPDKIDDMLGNVRQWCADHRPRGRPSAVVVPESGTSGLRAIRGVAYGYQRILVDPRLVTESPPISRLDDLGFRLAR